MKCEYCGREFESTAKNAKYCCSNCRLKAFRERKKADREKELARENQREKFQVKRQRRESEKTFEKDRKQRAAAGDPFARMMIAKRGTVEYWRAFQAYQLEKSCCCSVNGVYIEDENFPEKVLETVRESQTIRIN